MSDRNILLYFFSSPMDYFLNLFIKYFKMELSRLSGEFPECFQVVLPEQYNQLNHCLMQFCLHLYLFSLDSSRLINGPFHTIELEDFVCLFYNSQVSFSSTYLLIEVSLGGRWTSITPVFQLVPYLPA